MKMETRIAFQNMKYHKNKNIVIGIAIFLTSFLLFLVPTIGNDMIDAQFASVNKMYPSWHALFREVDAETANKISVHHDISTYGLRSDLGIISDDDAGINLMYLDEEAFKLYRLSLKEGKLPEKENEIVVSKGILKELGIDAKIGDTIKIPYQIYRNDELDYVQEREFKICGFIEDTKDSIEKKMFNAYASKDFMLSEIPKEQISYYFLLQVVGKKGDVTDDYKKTINGLADQFGIAEKSVRINDDYLMANYVDPVTIPVIVGIIGIIILAGVITIYSIYYVNMPERVQEFGRLKSIGATKRQIKQIVFREGLCITMIALPLGLIVSTVLVKIIFKGFFQLYHDENFMMSTIKEIIANNEISLYHGWIYLLAIVTTLITVYLSLKKPMNMAAKISEIDAMRFGQENSSKKSKKKNRKSYGDITIFKLSKIYLFGNKKNSAITIISMGITGIFLMVIATVLSCANPKESANNDILGQYSIGLNTESGNKEHPEREWKQVIKNNPLNDNLKKQIESIDGITSVSCFKKLNVTADSLDEGEGLYGVPKEHAEQLIDGIIQGEITYEELMAGDKIIVDENLLYWYPDIKVGDQIEIKIEDGTSDNIIHVEVAAIGDYPIGFTNFNYFLTTDTVVEKLSKENVNAYFQVFADKSYDKTTFDALNNLIAENEFLGMNSWKDKYEEWKSAMTITSGACYAFLGVISMICIMNMINTMINSVHIRKKEIGMMQAIGMTDAQLVKMLQQEGMFYTIGTLFMSVGLGSLLGYPVFLWAKSNAMFSISQYHYPVAVAVIVTVVLIVIQAVMAFALGKSVKKESLTERIRFSE